MAVQAALQQLLALAFSGWIERTWKDQAERSNKRTGKNTANQLELVLWIWNLLKKQNDLQILMTGGFPLSGRRYSWEEAERKIWIAVGPSMEQLHFQNKM